MILIDTNVLARSVQAEHAVAGKGAHDARVVAAMIVHRVDRILTFNMRDFRRYPGIAILDPLAIGA